MSCFYLSSIILLISLFVKAHSCERGWFGEQCQYRCHCERDSCNNRGDCEGGTKCVPGWFGNQCQYRNLLSSSISPTWASDGDSSTCNSEPDHHALFFTPNETFTFTWMWLEVKDTKFVSLMLDLPCVSLGRATHQVSNCSDMTYFALNSRTVEVHGATVVVNVTTVILVGGSLQHLCNVYISWGRSLVYKQTTNHSSGPESLNSAVSDHLAGFDEVGNLSTCDPVFANSDRLFLRLARPFRISTMVLIGQRGAKCLESLSLTQFAFLESSNTTLHYHFSSGQKLLNDLYCKLYAILPTMPVVRTLGFKAVKGALCQLQAFGESECPVDFYGRECEERCLCASGRCNVATGACTEGCPVGRQFLGCSEPCSPGMYGPGCSRPCSSHCRKLLCHSVTGKCLLDCQAGYKPPYCRECDDNHYGETCRFSCFDTCLNGSCESRTGNCHHGCKHGFHGRRCHLACPSKCLNHVCNWTTGLCDTHCHHRHCKPMCKPGFFGSRCQFECPRHCTTGTCRGDDGFCTQRCPDGYHGDHCTDKCPDGTHGTNCVEKCPTTCAGDTCNHESGECLSCRTGYYGRFCQTEDHPSWIFAVFAVLIPLALCGVCLVRRTPYLEVEEGGDDFRDSLFFLEELESNLH